MVQLRPERPDDRSQTRDVVARAFGDDGEQVAVLLDDLRAAFLPDQGLSLVADDAGELVGHVMFTSSLLDAPRRLVDVQVLSPLAVRPDRQRRGIGAALIREGIRALDERSVPLVFLEGDPAYYARRGFLAGAELGFRKPSLRIPDTAFQVVTLSAYEPWMSGTLVYSEIFWRHDAVGLRDPSA